MKAVTAVAGFASEGAASVADWASVVDVVRARVESSADVRRARRFAIARVASGAARVAAVETGGNSGEPHLVGWAVGTEISPNGRAAHCADPVVASASVGIAVAPARALESTC